MKPQEALPDLPEIVAKIEAALALGPTSGEWHWQIHDHSMATLGVGMDPGLGDPHVLTVTPCRACAARAEPKEWRWGRCLTPSEADAVYIATACPDNIRALLSERTRLQAAEVEVMRLRVALLKCAVYADDIIKTASKDRDDWIDDVERIGKLARAALIPADPKSPASDHFTRLQARIDEADAIILRLTADHNSSPNYVRGFDAAQDYFARYAP